MLSFFFRLGDNLLISSAIRARLTASGSPFRANDNIAAHLLLGEVEAIEAEASGHVEALLRSLVIDVDHDHNTAETARRVAKMYVREVFAGRYQAAPAVTSFPNVRQVDEVYAVGPIVVRSACSHHMVPILGNAWVGVIPGERVIGLSKFSRIADWVMSRPQIQEEAAEQLADAIGTALGDHRGLALVIRARHLCCGWRGVRDQGQQMTTSVMRGFFKEDAKARAEFFSIIQGMEF